MLDTHARKYVNPLIKSLAKFFIKFNITANQITIAAFTIGLLPFLFIYINKPIIACILLWASGLLDAVDGEIARATKTPTAWGTLMDITFDRLVELGVILGIALKFPLIRLNLLFLTSTIIISMTIFLTVGALSDHKGIKSFYYQAGIAERTEGFIMFTLMILLPSYLTVITSIFSILVLLTALQRMLEAKKLLS